MAADNITVTLTESPVPITVTLTEGGVGLPAGGDTDDILKKSSADDYDAEWAPGAEAANGLPAEGTTGQVLKKASDEDYDVVWDDESGGATDVDDLTTTGWDAGNFPRVAGAGGFESATPAQVVGSVAPDAIVVVQRGATDADSGTALVAAYAAACALTPGGNALSASNRAVVLIPPGGYELSAALVLDTDFVDLAALAPAEPAHRLATDEDPDPTLSAADLSSFRPQPTMVYTEVEKICVINQTAANVRLSYFTIAQLSPNTNFVAWDTPYGALWIGDVDNTPSVYFGLYCWSNQAYPQIAGAVAAWESFGGTWFRCVANSASFRVGIGDQITPSAIFSAKMYDCEAGAYSYIGDYYGTRGAFYSASGCRFERCISIGIWAENDDSSCSFAGCGFVSTEVDDTCWFIDCISGAKSFGMGNTIAGNFIRCRGGANCFAGNVSATPGIFSGYAEDCVAGSDSFGGTTAASDGDPSICYCSGTLIRCTGTGNTRPLNLTGATLRDCKFTNTTHDQHCIVLLDSNSTITGCELLVDATGTGVPIYAATALDVVASAVRFNNSDVAANGIGENVSNLDAIVLMDQTGLTLTAAAVGFTVAGGTDSRTLTVTNTGVAATEDFVLDLVSGQANFYFDGTVVSGIEREMQPTTSADAITNIDTATISSSTTTALATFVADIADTPLTLAAGVIDAHVHALRASGNRTLSLRFTVHKRTSGVDGATICTSDDILLTDTEANIDPHAVVTAPVTFDGVNDQLVIKFFIVSTGGATNTVGRMRVAGSTTSHVSAPITTSAFDHVYVPLSTYDAHTILAATSDNTPAALTVTEQTVVGRVTGGNIAAIAIDADLSSVSANDDTIPSAKATKAALDAKASNKRTLIFDFDGGGAAIAADTIAMVRLPFGFSAVTWSLIGSANARTGAASNCAITLMVYVDNWSTSAFPTTDVVGAGTDPALSAATGATAATNWDDEAWASGQMVMVKPSGTPTAKWATLIIDGTET